MNVWTVAREYAGIAEAGGVKNVTRSISEALSAQGQNVTLFIPLYGCTNLSEVSDFSCLWHEPVTVTVQEKKILISFSHGKKNGVDIVFIGNKHFSEKQAVYTYTRTEEKENPCHRHGCGHEDVLFLNTLFQKAVIAYGSTCSYKEKPDIIHCHDATAAMIPVFMESYKKKDSAYEKFYADTKCVVTIHNAGSGYHHEYNSLEEAKSITGLSDSELIRGLSNNKVEPFLLSADCAVMTTVSPEYAKEIIENKFDSGGLAYYFRKRNIKIIGITNGIDYERYNPLNTECSELPFAFNPIDKNFAGKYKCRETFIEKYASNNYMPANENITKYGYLAPEKNNNAPSVFIVYHGRVVRQKGISVLLEAAKILLEERMPIKFIFIGQGEQELEEELIRFAKTYKGKSIYFNGYDKSLSRLCIASSDFAIMPSEFEPCGTEDFIAQIFGTVPIAHA
nr:glycogen/starch synthase [Treponema sp.]